MELPSSFTDYTRALLGVEEYEKLAAALEGEQPVSIRLNEDKLPESSFSLFSFLFGACSLVCCRILSGQAADIHFRPAVSCRLLLCAGGFVHVCGAGFEAVCGRRTGGDA